MTAFAMKLMCMPDIWQQYSCYHVIEITQYGIGHCKVCSVKAISVKTVHVFCESTVVPTAHFFALSF